MEFGVSKHESTIDAPERKHFGNWHHSSVEDPNN
jgi:hypothetical protein